VSHLNRCVSSSALALIVGLSLTGCGSYDDAAPAVGGTAGQTTTIEMANAAGQPMTGAEAGSTGALASGGSGMGAAGANGATAPPSVEASCESVAPCGGDVVGTWVVAGSCLPVSGEADMSGFGLGCTSAPVTGALEVTGTWTANADGTFTDETTTLGDVQLELPSECLNVSGTIAMCDRLSGALQSLGLATVDCVEATGGGCTCSATADQAGGMARLSFDAASSGTYASADDVVTTSGRAGVDYSYCTSGDTMTMTPTTASQVGTLTGTIALVRQ
jgi:hypothetical protein